MINFDFQELTRRAAVTLEHLTPLGTYLLPIHKKETR